MLSCSSEAINHILSSRKFCTKSGSYPLIYIANRIYCYLKPWDNRSENQ